MHAPDQPDDIELSPWQDPSLQEFIRTWQDQGRTPWWIEGWIEGWMNGRLEEARRPLHRALAVCSVVVTADVPAQIDRETDVARLEAWIEAVVMFFGPDARRRA